MKTDNYRIPADRPQNIVRPAALATPRAHAIYTCVLPNWPQPAVVPSAPVRIPAAIIPRKPSNFPKYARRRSVIHAETAIKPAVSNPRPRVKLDPTLTLSCRGVACLPGVGRGTSCPCTFLKVVSGATERGCE